MFDENVFLFVTNLVIFVLCGGIFMIMPHLTRKSYLFGVKIPPEQAGCPEAKDMKKHYILACFLGTIVMLVVCVVQFIILREKTLITTMYLPFLIIPVFLAAFIPCWKKALRLKEERGWQVSNILFAETSSSHTRGNLSALPWAWYVLSFVIIVAALAAAVTRYPVLPDMIAGHLDHNLQPTYLVEKTWMNVLAMPLINASTLALMIMVAVFIEKAKLQIDPSNPGRSFAQHRVYRRRLGHAMGFLTFSVVIFMAVFGLPFIFPDSEILGAGVFWSGIVFINIPIILVIAVQFKTGQGGCKVVVNIDENADYQTPAKSGGYRHGKTSDDKYWKLGMFYCNPDDPACIVEDRFGTNLGFNYSRLPVKIGVAVMLLGLAALYVWVTMQVL